MDVRASRPVERAFVVPGGFPAPAVAERPRSRSRPAASEAETTHSRAVTTTTSHTGPLRGILKNPIPQIPQIVTRPQDPLAARFNRVTRPDQQSYTASAPPSPTYHSDSDRFTSYDTDSQSASSDLSTSTDATSVISDSSVPPKPSKPSTQVKHVRHVQSAAASSKVRTRTRSRTPSEVSKPPVPEKKRTVHIQFVPAKQQAPSQSQELQLARKPDNDLVHKIEQLELETDSLRQERSKLNRDLDDVSVQLSTRGQENKEIVRALNIERNSKELILRDLEEQRQISDEFRSNYQLQQNMLIEVERERDSLRHMRDKFEQQVADLEREISVRDAAQREQEDALRRDIETLEHTTASFERQMGSRNKDVKELSTEVKELNAELKDLDCEVKELTSERDLARRQSHPNTSTYNHSSLICKRSCAVPRTTTDPSRAAASAKAAHLQTVSSSSETLRKKTVTFTSCRATRSRRGTSLHLKLKQAAGHANKLIEVRG
ncbi:hypothetical protein F5Y11DRAFT_306091 [Daldinia sp. FL1419]|nr:hypothetical protein F5Y11DRAFT_306091 [Daldinia sp. FL1419]